MTLEHKTENQGLPRPTILRVMARGLEAIEKGVRKGELSQKQGLPNAVKFLQMLEGLKQAKQPNIKVEEDK